MADLHSDLPPAIVPATFDALPDLPAINELKSRRQWVAWKYEDRGGPKPTKPPVCPRTGFGASHSKPETWGSYDEAVTRVQRSRLDGVGYVLSPDDGLSGADLDDCYDTESGDIEPWAKAIVDLAETYTEFSPSGTGLRLIWRSKIDKAIKADAVHVEVYGAQRYLTITGWHLQGTPTDIRPAPKTLAALQARVDAAKPAPPTAIQSTLASVPLPAAFPGDSFFRDVNSAALAALSLWVPALFPAAKLQPATGAYRVTSRSLGRDLQEDLSIAPNGIVDFGIHDMGDARDGKRTPVDLVVDTGAASSPKEAAFWLCGRLAKTPESFGWHERSGREVIDVAGILADAETGEIIEPERPAASIGMPEYLLDVPGLVGDIANWITGTAKRPQKVLALTAALMLVGTAAGRHMAGPTQSGTHIYAVGLAKTGYGKEHVLQCIARILEASRLLGHLGPDEFISMPAVINFLCRAPLSLCRLDEFGAFLKRINGRKASNFEAGISKIFRSAWGASFGTLMTPEWAGRSSAPIMSPAMSIYGTGAPHEFYAALSGLDINNGLLNRFLVLEAPVRPADVEPVFDPRSVPERISKSLNAIYSRGGEMVTASLNRADAAPQFETVPWADDIARQAYLAFSKQLEADCETEPDTAPFLARTAEYAVRLATIRAIGRDLVSPTVSASDVRWAAEFSRHCADFIIRGVRENMAENDHQANAKMVLSYIRQEGKITRAKLYKKVDHRLDGRSLEGILTILQDAGDIEILSNKTKGRSGFIYLFKG